MHIHRMVCCAFGLAIVLGACGVNEMPEYRDRITSVSLAPLVSSSGEVVFASGSGGEGDSAAAVDVFERELRERLAQRVQVGATPMAIEEALESALLNRFARRFQWGVDDNSYDTRFSVELIRYGIEVDELGVATAFYELRIRGDYLPEGVLIYDQRETLEISIVGDGNMHPSLSNAEQRARNLMDLDGLGQDELQRRLLDGAQRAANDAIDQLFSATYE